MIKPIRKNILFIFLDEIVGGQFQTKTESGIILRSFDDSIKGERWGKVLAVGPEVTEVNNGEDILIEALQWTEGFVHDGVKVWMTQEDKVLCVKIPS